MGSIKGSGAVPLVSFSNIEGGWPADGNIDVDPCFVEPGYWADPDDPNIIVEPNDPNAVWINGDYHLMSEAELMRWYPWWKWIGFWFAVLVGCFVVIYIKFW